MKPVAVISGGTRGIGYALARLLHPTHDLVIVGRNAQHLARVEEEFGARTLAQDLSDLEEVEPAVATLGLERVEVLVHSAGVLHTGILEETTNAQFTESFAVNVTAVAALTRALVPALKRARGRVVMLNSGSGKRGTAGSGVYAASKFALNGLAECMRLELGPAGVQVSTVAPGRTDTDMQHQLVA